MKVVVVVVVAGLFVLQGFGILFSHGHPADVGGHQHQFASYGDGHVGHAEDVIESTVGHADASVALTPAATDVAFVVPMSVVAIGSVERVSRVMPVLLSADQWSVGPTGGVGILRV